MSDIIKCDVIYYKRNCIADMYHNGENISLVCATSLGDLEIILPELRTQNYLFDLIYLHFCYNNTIQYNTVQFMGLFIFLLVKETPIKVR